MGHSHKAPPELKSIPGNHALRPHVLQAARKIYWESTRLSAEGPRGGIHARFDFGDVAVRMRSVEDIAADVWLSPCLSSSQRLSLYCCSDFEKLPRPYFSTGRLIHGYQVAHCFSVNRCSARGYPSSAERSLGSRWSAVWRRETLLVGLSHVHSAILRGFTALGNPQC